MYTDTQIDEIRSAAEADFVRLVESAGVPVTMRSNGTFRCPCPIHSGTHLNFFWNPASGQWHCNSKCTIKHGDVFDFVQRMGWATTYMEAVHWLSDKTNTGIAYERPVYEPEVLIPLDESELRWCRHFHPYWKRVSRKTQLQLGGGYCAAPWHPLCGRVTFPVRDTSGVLVGIVGRTCGEIPDEVRRSATANQLRFIQDRWDCRYVNFGASKLGKNGKPRGGFAKGLVLYNYHQAQHPTLPLLVVEGPFDVARAVEHGWDHVVALLGKTVTETQRNLLISSGRPLIYGLDPETYSDGTFAYFASKLAGTNTRLHQLHIRAEDVGASTVDAFWSAFTTSLATWEIL